MKLHIPALAISFLSKFTPSHDIRYYLNGIHVRPMSAEEGGGVLLAATDGFMAGIWHAASGSTCERPATLQITAETVAACRKNSSMRHITITSDRLAVIEQAGKKPPVEIYIQPSNTWADANRTDLKPWEVPGKHPASGNLLDVFHNEVDRGPTCQIDSGLLKAVAAAFRAGCDMGTPSLCMRQKIQSGPVLVLSENIPHAAAVLMPRQDCGLKRPEWIDRAKSARAQAEAAAKCAPLPVHEPSDAGPPDGDGRGWAFVEGGAA